MYSLLSDDSFWLLIGYTLRDASIIIWLFPCLDVWRVQIWLLVIFITVINIAHWLLLSGLVLGITIWLLVIFITFLTIGISLFSVQAYAKSPNLASWFLPRFEVYTIALLIFLCTLCFSKFFIQVLYHSLHFALQNVCINNLS